MVPPDKIYVEVWPEELDREVAVYFEPTGYGVDLTTGATSTIYVYELKKPRKRGGKRGTDG